MCWCTLWLCQNMVSKDFKHQAGRGATGGRPTGLVQSVATFTCQKGDLLYYFIILYFQYLCAPRVPVPRRKQPNSSDRNPRPSRNGVHQLTYLVFIFAIFQKYVHKNKTTIRNPNKVAPYVAPVGTWGDFEDSGGGSCATETDTCDARFFSYPFLVSCFDAWSLSVCWKVSHHLCSQSWPPNWSKLVISGSPMKRTCSVPGACTGKYLACRKLTVIFYF